MNMNFKVALFAAMTATACSQEKPANDAGSAGDTARAAPAAAHDMNKMPSAQDTTGMAGMDHSAMGATQPGAPTTHTMPADGGGAMAGMDHSRMPAGNARAGSMSGMDHSAMTRPGSGSQAMAGMDHSRMNMPSNRRAAASAATSGMPNHTMPMGDQSPQSGRDPHAGMVMTPGMSAQPAPPDTHEGMEMEDEPAEKPLPDDVAMEKLRALVAELVRDPDVLARIQADPALRALWQNPGVRQYLLKRP
jgi:hypothetical protein